MTYIYLMGICGTGMGTLAGLLAKLGHTVRGSDAHVYPPMSTTLADWGIEVLNGFDAQHLQPKPDLVIVGNVIRENNPEAVYMRAQHIPYMSMAQAVAEFGIQNKHSIVVAGTHGKTTTSALIAHVLQHAGLAPSYLIGGALPHKDGARAESFAINTGKFFVVEGDEYDTAYFDKRSKFLHYRAQTALITSLEYDHADIFTSIEAIDATFAKLLETVPATGHVIVWHGATRARALLQQHCKAVRITVYATQQQPDANLWLASYTSGPNGLTFVPVMHGNTHATMQVPLWGDFSACNVLAALAALQDAHLSDAQLQAGFASFQGVKRRMEIRAQYPHGITIVDDFAHHPTAVEVTLAAARTRFPGQRIWAIFEPRSATSRRNIFQDAYAHAFMQADKVILASHPRLQEVDAQARFNPELLIQQLTGRGVDAVFLPTTSAIVAHVVAHTKPGDVIMVLSNGDFDGLIDILVKELKHVTTHT